MNESDGYSISVPTPWDIVESPDGVVTASGASTTVTIETSFIDRVATPNVQIYSAGHSPSFSGAWTDVQQLSTTSIRNGQAIEFHYQGSLNGTPQEMFIHWYFRGSLLIQVETRVDSQSWADKGVQDEVRDIVASFNPDANGALKTADDVLDALTARFAANAHSGIIARDEAAQGTVELTCAKAAEPYVQPPQYTGPGEWTVTTGLAPYGYNQWLVYEPDMQVVAGAGNATRC